MSFSSQRSRGSLRRAVVTVIASLGLLSLSACGTADPFDSLTIDAKAGEAPEVKWDGELDVESTGVKVLVEGDGEVTENGDIIDTYIWIGNGYSQEEVLSTYSAETAEQIELTEDLVPGLKQALVGHPAGSVVAVAAAPEDAFGEGGNAYLNIGDGDTVLFIAEIVKKYSDDEVAEIKAEAEKVEEQAAAAEKKLEKARKDAPKKARGKTLKPAAWAPKVTYKKGQVPVFDFKGVPKPNGKLQVTTLIEGQGKKVQKGQTLIVQYVGQVFGADEPFDSSYGRGEAAEFQIGVGAVVEGWDKSLVGQKVGSRVIVQIPPKLGYGESGNEGAGIGGTDTIVFSVDILAAV